MCPKYVNDTLWKWRKLVCAERLGHFSFSIETSFFSFRSMSVLRIILSASVQFSRVWLSVTLWTAARQASLSITNSQCLLRLMSIESVMPSTVSSSVVPFSSCPQSLPASGSFPMSQLFVWCGQSIGISASTSVLSMNTQKWFPLGWAGWISLKCERLSRVFSNTTVQKH